MFEQKYGVGFVIDIILNHCSGSSPFIQNNPTATYNLTNSPYLRSAYVLDNAIKEFSDSLAAGDCKLYKKGNIIETEEDLQVIMTVLRESIIPSLHLEEYFQMDIDKILSEFKSEECEGESDYVQVLKIKGMKKFIKDHGIRSEGEDRFSIKLNGQLI